MKDIINAGAVLGLLATPAFSGGWEASKLSTSHLYEDGNYAEFSVLPLTYDVGATIQYPGAPKHKVLSDQTRAAMAVKIDLGNFDIGVSKYMSGALLFEGQRSIRPLESDWSPSGSVDGFIRGEDLGGVHEH